MKRPPFIGLTKGGKRGERNPVVLGRRFCVRCGRWRLLCDFPHSCGRGVRVPVWSYCYGCARAVARERWQRIKADPERHRDLAEYRRFYYDAVDRDRRGVKGPDRRANRRHSVIDHPERILLDPAPLLAELERFTTEADEHFTANGHRTIWTLLAKQSGVSQRALYRLRYGESKHVRIDIADKLCVAIGVPLSVLYPLEAT